MLLLLASSSLPMATHPLKEHFTVEALWSQGVSLLHSPALFSTCHCSALPWPAFARPQLLLLLFDKSLPCFYCCSVHSSICCRLSLLLYLAPIRPLPLMRLALLDLPLLTQSTSSVVAFFTYLACCYFSLAWLLLSCSMAPPTLAATYILILPYLLLLILTSLYCSLGSFLCSLLHQLILCLLLWSKLGASIPLFAVLLASLFISNCSLSLFSCDFLSSAIRFHIALLYSFPYSALVDFSSIRGCSRSSWFSLLHLCFNVCCIIPTLVLSFYVPFLFAVMFPFRHLVHFCQSKQCCSILPFATSSWFWPFVVASPLLHRFLLFRCFIALFHGFIFHWLRAKLVSGVCFCLW